MDDLDDGPGQPPLAQYEIERAILRSLPSTRFDRVFTHRPAGEYTRHRRLDILDDANDATILKEAQTLNIFPGTGSDKLLKQAQLEKPQQDNRTLVIVIPGLEAGIDNLTIDGRHPTTTFDVPLDSDILPPSD